MARFILTSKIETAHSLAEYILEEVKSCIGTKGENQLCLDLKDNPTVGKNLQKEAEAQKATQKKAKAEAKKQASAERKQNAKAREAYLSQHQQGLF